MKLNRLSTNFLKHRISGYVSKDQKLKVLNQYLRLDLGENLLGCNPKVLAALKKTKKKDLVFYADPSAEELKTVITRVHSLKRANVLIGNSTDEIIATLPKIILNPKEKALVIVPTFFRFIESTLSAGGKPIYLKLASPGLADKIITITNRLKIKLIWLCNPNNPDGTVLRLNQIKNIVTKTKAFVILDEAFYEYYDLSNKDSGIKLVNQCKNLIVLRTLSKAYGLAGLRFGYALAHKNTIEPIAACLNTLLMTSNIIQKVALTALGDKRWLEETVQKTRNLRENALSILKKNPNLILLGNSRTNVFLVKHKTKDLFVELKKRGILTADFRNTPGLEGQKCVRITVGKKSDNARFLKTIKTI